MSIIDGRGSYAVLNMNSNAILKLMGNNTVLTLVSDGRESRVSAAMEITLATDSPIKIYARTPKISSSGNICFTDLYPAGLSEQRKHIFSQNLNITGHISFDIFLSDSYKFISNFEVEGSYNMDPQVFRYDELSSLPTAAFWSLVLLPVFLGITLIIIRRNRWQ